jgi:hypothetical protein
VCRGGQEREYDSEERAGKGEKNRTSANKSLDTLCKDRARAALPTEKKSTATYPETLHPLSLCRRELPNRLFS